MNFSFSNHIPKIGPLISNPQFSPPKECSSKNNTFFTLDKNDMTSKFDPFPSLFDNLDKSDSKQYFLFKKISPVRPLTLNLNNKLFEDTVEVIDNCVDNINCNSQKRYFAIFSTKNYKAKLIYYENGGPKYYLNLSNVKYQ